METPPELPHAPSPAPATPVAAVPVAATAVPVSSKTPPTAELEDKCELASPGEEAMPVPSATACPEPAAPPPAEEAGAEVCPEPSSALASPGDAPGPLPVPAGPCVTCDTSSARAAGPEPVAEVAQAEGAALTVELEPSEAPPAELESAPSPPSAAHAAPSPPLTPPPTPPPPSPLVSVAAVTTTTPSPPPLLSPSALPVVQGDLEGEESTRTTLSEEVKDTEKKEETETDGQLEESQEALSVNLSRSPVPGKLWALWVCVVNCRMKERGFFFFEQVLLFLSAKEKSVVVPRGCCDCEMLIFVGRNPS